MNKIRYFVFPIILLSQNVLAVNSKYPCDQPIFSGLDIKHIHAVSVCLSNNHVSYTYSKLNSNKNDLDILIERKYAAWDYYATQADTNVLFGTIAIKNGPYVYKMTSGKDQKGLLKSFITVYKDNNVLSIIPLDPKTVVNQVSPLLKHHGIPSFKDKQYEYQKRSLADSFYFS